MLNQQFHGSRARLRGLAFYCFGSILTGCAGPTTPFGGIHQPWVKSVQTHEVKKQTTPVLVQIFPRSQVLHQSSPIKVSIYDPRGLHHNSTIRTYHNGIDVTDQLFSQSSIYRDEDSNSLVVEFRDIKIRPGHDNEIEFRYFRNPKAEPVITKYETPRCHIKNKKEIRTIKPFQADQETISEIARWAKFHAVNPSLLAGLIAQESAFDPRAVSWAKAIGLTQVTPIGDEQIKESTADWPRSEKISRLPAMAVKALVSAGQISSEEDWRLDHRLSIRGGLTLFDYMVEYWKKHDLHSYHGEPESESWALTQLALASYHSGAARVKNEYLERGTSFLKAPNLSEARKYVDKVASYCFHFSTEGDGL